jgi:hypothetical protein
MPPRYAYWTILVDDQPTAFRSGSQEELMPTFNRLQQKHASAKMMWWQNGKLWASRIDAQEARRARGEIGRSHDVRQRPALSGGRPTASAGRRESKGERYSDRAPRASERREERDPSGKLDWKPKGEAAPAFRKERSAKPEWKPKGSFTPERQKFAAEGRESRPSAKREGGPEWKPKGSFTPERQKFAAEGRESRRGAKREGGPEWKPKSFGARPKSDWKPRSSGAAKRPWTPRSQESRPRSEGKLEWQPKGQDSRSKSYAKSQDPSPKSPEKRKWVPKAEYKKSLGVEAKKDKNWRPGGEHKDPRQKYKDAKKAKWGRFKQTVRKRSEAKGKKDDK